MSDEPNRTAGPRHAWMLLVGLVLIAYAAAALTAGFVVDDHRFITDNAWVRSPDSWLRPLWDPSVTDPAHPTGIVRPLRTIEFALDHAVFGLRPLGFHLHSLVWHALATVLLFRLLVKVVRHHAAAFTGAALWGLHPMNTESVAWISSRGDVAMGACTLGALLVLLRSKGADRWLAVALGLGAVAMLYKETAVVLPLLVFAVRLARPARGPPGNLRSAAVAALPWAVLSLLFVLYRDGVRVGDTAHVESLVGGSVVGTFSTMFRGFGAYLGFAALPARPGFDWFLSPTSSLTAPTALAWLLVHAGLVVTAVRLRSRRPVVAAGIAVFYFALLPVANWPFPLGIPTAERFLYLPLVGFALVIAAAWARGGAGLRKPLQVVTVCFFAISTVRAADWRSDEALLAATLQSHDSPRALATRGSELRNRGWDERVRARAAGDTPEGVDLRQASDRTLGDALAHLDRSIAVWRRQITPWPPVDHPAGLPLAEASNVALLLGRREESIRYADDAVVAAPADPKPHYNRAWSLLGLGRAGEAVSAMRRAADLGMVQATAEFVRFYGDCGRRLVRKGDTDLARRAFQTALDLRVPGALTDAVRGDLLELGRR